MDLYDTDWSPPPPKPEDGTQHALRSLRRAVYIVGGAVIYFLWHIHRDLNDIGIELGLPWG